MQLDFDLKGPTPSSPLEPEVLSVGAFTRRMRSVVESQFGDVWVEGEASNVRRQSSGHTYFTLKDATAQIACVLFAGQAAQLRGVKITDGDQLQIFGQVTIYEMRGQYQIVVRRVAEVGAGALQAKFEELKRRLHAEGLFDAARKKSLPAFPQRVGVVTSPTGAALRDFLNVLSRRQRGIAVLVSPVRVQGRGAAAEIAKAIKELARADANGLPRVDVIVVTRGGGSLEDLWEFNEEVVARAIAESEIPVISAIGHEIDFTIADFAADVRAPTPSAAAELLSADQREVLDRIRAVHLRMNRVVGAVFERQRQTLHGFQRTAVFQAPARAIREMAQTLDRGSDNLLRSVREAATIVSRRIETMAIRLDRQDPAAKIASYQRDISRALDGMSSRLMLRKQHLASECEKSAAVLEALSPMKALGRGYSLTHRPNGGVVLRADTLTDGDEILTTFADGVARSIVSTSAKPLRLAGLKK